jgi:hypothetical protein
VRGAAWTGARCRRRSHGRARGPRRTRVKHGRQADCVKAAAERRATGAQRRLRHTRAVPAELLLLRRSGEHPRCARRRRHQRRQLGKPGRWGVLVLGLLLEASGGKGVGRARRRRGAFISAGGADSRGRKLRSDGHCGVCGGLTKFRREPTDSASSRRSEPRRLVLPRGRKMRRSPHLRRRLIVLREAQRRLVSVRRRSPRCRSPRRRHAADGRSGGGACTVATRAKRAAPQPRAHHALIRRKHPIAAALGGCAGGRG